MTLSSSRDSDFPKWALLIEYALIFLTIPVILYFHATRWNVPVILWLAALYSLMLFNRLYKSSWHDLWHGTGWSSFHRKSFLLRFLAITSLVVIITGVVLPDRLFSFPLQRPGFWLLVMFLYPLLSVLPQEFIFRSFFFKRYAGLFSHPLTMSVTNAFSFGFMHVIFHNIVSPLLCLIAGAVLAYSYRQHRSLKWAVIEHAAYGCMVFTVGLGSYFYVGGIHP